MTARACGMIGVVFVLFAGLLFGAAGTAAWTAGWVFLALFFVGELVLTALLAARDPALLTERFKSFAQEGQPVSDRILMSVFLGVFAAWFVLIGLDARFGWSAVPIWLQWVGGAGVVVSKGIAYRTFRENTFAVAVVRIQAERGQRVISTGPYAVVRHPLYTSFLVLFVSTALLLGSWWGLATTPLLAGWVVVRIALEECELKMQLPGYAEYAARVPYRVLPFVW